MKIYTINTSKLYLSTSPPTTTGRNFDTNKMHSINFTAGFISPRMLDTRSFARFTTQMLCSGFSGVASKFDAQLSEWTNPHIHTSRREYFRLECFLWNARRKIEDIVSMLSHHFHIRRLCDLLFCRKSIHFFLGFWAKTRLRRLSTNLFR